MTCEDARGLLQAYVDGEFGPVEGREFELHMGVCEGCRGRVGFETWFREGLRSTAPVAVAPAALRASIQRRIQETPTRGSGRVPVWAAVPAALAIAAMATLAAMVWGTVDAQPTPVVDAVRMHRRALPAEVAPADPDAVRRWFWGKVNFPVRPPIPQTAGPNAVPARFLGARVSHVGRFPAAHMMYDVGGARVSVLAFQGPASLPTRDIRRVGERDVHFGRMDGYNVAFSRSGDVTYAVTGDVPQARMVRFLPAGEGP